jgi:hypothetical protein
MFNDSFFENVQAAYLNPVQWMLMVPLQGAWLTV